jgi:DNA ligase-1
MKAPSDPITDQQLASLHYPLVGSPKYDGIRALCTGFSVLSSSLKPLGNQYIQKCLSHPDYAGLDGELIVGSPTAMDKTGMSTVFNTTTGAVRRADGKPDFKFYVFDDFEFGHMSYQRRWLDVMKDIDLPHVIVAEQRILTCRQDVLDYEAELVELGYEGMMPRSISAKYKEGRATLKEALIFKRKPVLDDEAQVIGFVEAMENQNEQTTNNLGVSTRSSHKENLVPKGTLGAFIMKSKRWKEPFNCGTGVGLTADLRQYIWDHQDEFMSSWWAYKYQGYGSIDKPRQPILKGQIDPGYLTKF